MKRLLAFLALVPALAFAKPVSFDFQGVSLVAFSQATFKGIMGRDYVIAPDVLGADRKITISVRNIDEADVPAFVESILQQQGVTVTERKGVFYLNAARSAAREAMQGTEEERAAAMYGPANLPPLARPGKVEAAPQPPHDEPKVGGFAIRREGDSSVVYMPKNRPSDFLAAVVASGFGQRAAQVAGSRLVVTGSPDEIKQITALLDALDVLPAKVDVSASWIEVARTDGQTRGISLLANVLGAKLGVQVGAIDGASVSLRNTNFELVVNALNNDGRFKQVSNSRVVGDEYETLKLTVGDETPTISSTGKDNSGNAVQNIVYRASGVIVDVTPKVLGSGRINMQIDGQISNFNATQTGVSGSPTLIKRQVKTAVTVADGEVLLIGGLNDNSTTESRSGLAFLPASWSAKQHAGTQTDLVLILSAKASSL